MLETGKWLVPYVGGKPFLRKPPLVNWAIAASFYITGVRNEWTARLPTALAVLALGLTIVALGGGWMNAETALVAGLMAMTSFGLLAKARFAGAEIEGIYVALTGIAMVTWMAWWTQRRSPWLMWTVPWIFLGLACLAKGPSLHLVFFYALVLAVSWRAKAWRELAHPAHFVGIAICAAIFAAWFVPFHHTPEGAVAVQVWKHQGLDRFTDGDAVSGNYFLNLPRGLMDQLPWLIFAPAVFAASRRAPDRLAALVRGVFIATTICFVVVLLVPGVLPRYVLPLAIPWCVLVAFALANRSRLVFIATAVLAGASILYAVIAVPIINRHDDLRPAAAQIDAAIPPGKPLIIYDPGYCAEIFYLRAHYQYAVDFDDIPAAADFVLARGDARRKFAKRRPDLVVTRTFKIKHDGELLLLQPHPALPKDAPPEVQKPDAPQ